MRLLQRSDTGELSFHSFRDSDTIPSYAILSHTWGADDEEVTFEDVENGAAETKPGYEKIRFCGEQAGRNGLHYFWIDTCCINKKDSVELSRSINSMFRWYRNATRCYVYLPDVSTTVGQGTMKEERDENVKDIWATEFPKSKWFTRGWTLQELIAPASVEFFSQNHERLGDKTSLMEKIHEVTGIPRSALQGAPLSQFSVDERLQWIDPRTTKLEEDKAYSLLGIFDVTMQLRYGEGMPAAFKRLEEAIDKLNKCIQDLRLTDPRHDKKRIVETKGGLLKDSYRWILEHSDFQQWRDDRQSQLLWVKGNAGKGKTMLLCGIIDELEKVQIGKNLAYFFFQATDSRLNNASAVLRGLVYLLIIQQPSLIWHVRAKYDHVGKGFFEDTNAWVALSEIFTNILQDPNLYSTYLVVDALDECETGLTQFLALINQSTSICPRIKWIISSRNRHDIEVGLSPNTAQRFSLELNAEHISRAVQIYINYEVSQLAYIEQELQEKVRNEMHRKADGTFLWVALVLQELKKVESWDILDVLNEIPGGLQQLYNRMMGQIEKLDRRDPDFCRLVLSTTTLVYRPLHLLELGTISGLPRQISNNVDNITKIIGKCSSFLTIREEYVYFVHQSAKDYLDSEDMFVVISPSGRAASQYDLFSRSIEAMSGTLQQDIYGLRLPGFRIESVQVPDCDPLAALRYSCVYWARHFIKGYQSDLNDGGKVHQFLQTYFLYWLEALSLIGEISEGILAITSLESCISVSRFYITYNSYINQFLRQRKVLNSTRSSTMRSDSPYTADPRLNRHPFNCTTQPLSSPRR
jgi:hypothetical protein